MGNFIQEDGFIRKLNERLNKEKSLIIQTNMPMDHVLQTICIIYSTKVVFFKSEIHLEEGMYYHYQISVVE
tara:strand:+ start:475 stop:687 length:213 start_codon:yes stop_codon:yes gene_type:complete